MEYDELLYLDVEFLSEKYEEQTGVAPNTVVSKNEGMKAQAGIPFLKSGLHSQVTKQYSSSNQTMLRAVLKSIEEYPVFEPNLEPGLRPCNVWVEGSFSIGQWGEEPNSKEAVNVFFEVESGEFCYSLLPQNEYFLANLETL